MSKTVPSTDVIVGIDTHKLTHAAAAISALGVRLGSMSIPANSKGYRALHTWAEALGPVRAFGVEGTGSYGAGLSRFLAAHGHMVLEVNRLNRQLRHQKGKDDALDAESAARAVLAGQATALPKSANSTVEMIRHLKIARDTAVKGRSQAMQTIKAIIVAAPATLREKIDSLTGKMTLLRHLAALRPGPLTSTTASAKTSLRAIARRWLVLDAEIKDHDAHLEPLTRQLAPELLQAHGMGAGPAADAPCRRYLSVSVRRQPWPSCVAPAPSRHPVARPTATGSIAAVTARPMPPYTAWLSSACAATSQRWITCAGAQPRAKANPRSFAA